MENYEKLYKEALKRAKGAHNSAKSDKENGDTDKITEYTIQLTEIIFPELKESEDEKIKKEIVDYLKGFIPHHDDELVAKSKVWISWLEKQGEKTNPYSGISFEYNGHIWGMCARDNGVDILLDKQLFKHLENQGEQKPTDLAKSNEEKAKEICGKGNPCCNKLCQFCNLSFVIDDVKQMAEWKDEQFKQDLDNAFKSADHVQYTNGWQDAVEKACEILAPTAISHKHVISLDNFHKAMQEGQQ